MAPNQKLKLHKSYIKGIKLNTLKRTKNWHQVKRLRGQSPNPNPLLQGKAMSSKFYERLRGKNLMNIKGRFLHRAGATTEKAYFFHQIDYQIWFSW